MVTPCFNPLAAEGPKRVLKPSGRTSRNAIEQAWVTGGLVFELFQRNPVNARIEPEDAGAFAVAVADSLEVVRNLAGIKPAIVGVKPAEVVDLGFPLHISRP